MNFGKKVITSALVSLGYFFSSMFANIVPCQTAPKVPNPAYVWSMCSFDPASISLSAKNLFFGYASDLRLAYFVSLIGLFLIVFLIISLINKEGHKKK